MSALQVPTINGKPAWRAPEDQLRRFLPKFYIDPDGCWIWTAAKNNMGYSNFYWMRSDGKAKVGYGHRWSYEYHYGPIPEGLTIDHVRARGCRSTLCVNPAHLEAVTLLENYQRGDHNQYTHATHCKWGHEFAGDNLALTKEGLRKCRACIKWRQERRRATIDEYLAANPHKPHDFNLYNRGCRCHKCKAASAAYQREWQRRKRSRVTG